MDRDNIVVRKINPRRNANFFSLITFLYTIKLYIKGYTLGIELNDIYEVLPACDAKKCTDKLEQQWIKHKTKSWPIFRALCFYFGKRFLFFGCIQLITTIIMTVWSPEAVSKLVSFYNPGQQDLTKQDAIFYGCLVISVNLLNSMVRHNCRILLAKMAIGARASVSGLIYKKLLKISPKALSTVTIGKIVTIITKDIDSLEYIFMSGNNIWIAVVETFVICCLIYRKIGFLSLAGVGFFLVLLPLQVYIGLKTYNYKLRCSRLTDKRLDILKEVLSSIKIVKMFAWEGFFEKRIQDARKKEMKELHNFFYAKTWILVIGTVSLKINFFMFLMFYTWLGHNITAEVVFYILSCFGNLENSLNTELPLGITILAELFATIKRVESVLNAEEVLPKASRKNEKPEMIFNNVSIVTDTKVLLKNITLTIDGGLNLIIGPTGCGKSNFLKTILQETEFIGNLKISGDISYASQEPWVFPSSIRNNILFGEDYNEEKYRKVIEVCCLAFDIGTFPKGDATIIGENGLNLSKGQQARINLARAVYKESDIYLFDNSLASLDERVSDEIFKQCICEFLQKKIRILVYDNPNYVSVADKVFIINDRHLKITKLKETSILQGLKNDTSDVEIMETTPQNVYHEEKRSGRVPLRHYHKYIQNGGGTIVFLIIIGLFTTTQFISSTSDKVLSEWINLEQNVTNAVDSDTKNELSYQSNKELKWYAILATASIILTLIQFFAPLVFIRRASVKIHKLMLHHVINATMKFFDSFYVGNIVNRFLKDCVTLDDTLPFVVLGCISMVFTISGGVILLTTVHYIFLIECLALLALVVLLKEFCQPTGRNLERLHIIARSPINGHVNSTLEGLISVRASNAEDLLLLEFYKHQNLFSSTMFLNNTAYIAFSMFIKYICMIFIGVIITQFFATDIGRSVGDVGLVITQSFVITNIIASAVQNIADAENLMISVERILQFTELKTEQKNRKDVVDWPKLGAITFENVSLEDILYNVSFSVKPQEKLAIIGRTGAGKSSVISALFQLYPTSGKITIDGVDITEISLTSLRSKMSLIPQDPVLFQCSIRDNLDPFKQYKDEEIWKVLKDLKLQALIENLDQEINKKTNFSSGQKQLICLARAALRKTRIIVLDEATANIDKATEEMAEQFINNYLQNCTLIIITHKINSIISCDKVLVMDNGSVKEFLDSKTYFAK